MKIDDYCKERFNADVISAMFEKCEAEGALLSVSGKYFTDFINMEKSQIEIIFKALFNEKSSEIMNNINNKKWTSDEQIISYLVSYFDMMSFGVVSIDDAGRFCYTKPVGDAPSHDIIEALNAKIIDCIPIVRDLLFELIQSRK